MARSEKDLKSELREFKELAEGYVSLKILTSMMFTEVPEKRPYCCDLMQQPQVRDFDHMLKLVNHVMDSTPS